MSAKFGDPYLIWPQKGAKSTKINFLVYKFNGLWDQNSRILTFYEIVIFNRNYQPFFVLGFLPAGVLDKSSIKTREGFKFQIPFSDRLSNLII
jgi:hypothetical protein